METRLTKATAAADTTTTTNTSATTSYITHENSETYKDQLHIRRKPEKETILLYISNVI
jgi:hypothetical protein